MATKVRYAVDGGLNVRKTAAGTKILTLNAGDLMYDISGVSEVTKSFEGSSYTWIKVHYYKVVDNVTTEGDGWVTKKNTITVSTTAPTKSSTQSSTTYINQRKMLVNARYIYSYLKNKGWSANAIFAVLGNFEGESTINPARRQVPDDDTDPEKIGYGLAQWTPESKYLNWVTEKAGISKKADIDWQLKYFIAGVSDSSLHAWLSSKHSPAMTFSAFTTSTKSCSVLAEYFLRCYENPASPDEKVPQRQAHAKKWKKLINLLL